MALGTATTRISGLLFLSSASSRAHLLARRRMSARAESLAPELGDTSKPLKVAALCGSLRRASYNRGLIRAAIEICEESIPRMHIEYVDIEPLPFLNTDLELDKKFPPEVETFRKKILEADSILFASLSTITLLQEESLFENKYLNIGGRYMLH